MAMEKQLNRLIGETLLEISDAIGTGQWGRRVRVGLTLLGSEHGIPNMLEGAERAQAENPRLEIVLIGPSVETDLPILEASTEEEMYAVMEKALDSGDLKACVTLHYNFPIGVATVGRVVTPATGRTMLLATTTGTASANRTEAMVKNALGGIIAAKTLGIESPSVGILNVDGARQVERALQGLDENGYPVRFAESVRADKGAVMRGNDLLRGSADVMVTDTLTGNILMKVLSSYATGGSYEAAGFGYGPGIGKGYDRTILILSRASGSPVVAGALAYAGKLAEGRLQEVARREYAAAEAAGLERILAGFRKEKENTSNEAVEAPEKEVVTAALAGIDIMDLEDAVQALWKAGVYAESGMGCTGPIVLVSEKNREKALERLAEAGFVSKEGGVC